jgi:hypothetical protein
VATDARRGGCHKLNPTDNCDAEQVLDTERDGLNQHTIGVENPEARIASRENY